MDGISKVVQRIHSIEQRFGQSKQLSGQSFDNTLKNAYASMEQPVNKGEITELIKQTALKNGVDPNLAIAVAKTESSLDPRATSPVGAAGVMQLMPDTARSLGVSNIYDPKENIEGGIRYLQQMMSAFNGDVKKALAAYNAGPEAVKKHNGVPPYAETQDYVAKVLASYKG